MARDGLNRLVPNCFCLSVRQHTDPQFSSRLDEMLREYDFPAGNLCLEITESGAIDGLKRSIQACRELHELGVMLAIDDFGNGYSSSKILFLRMKLDQSLICDIDANRKEAIVVQSAIFLSRRLKMDAISEVGERKAQTDFDFRI